MIPCQPTTPEAQAELDRLWERIKQAQLALVDARYSCFPDPLSVKFWLDKCQQRRDAWSAAVFADWQARDKMRSAGRQREL